MARMQASLAELQATHFKVKAAMEEKTPIVLTPRARRQPSLQSVPRCTSRASASASAETYQQHRHSAGSVAGSSTYHAGFSGRDLPIAAAKPGQKYYDPSVAYSDDVEVEAAKSRSEKPIAKHLVSGGLTHFPVAPDLAFVDFNSHEELQEPNPEFKAIPWNMEINPDVGGYGPFDSDSHELLAYLSKLEEQQRVVIQLMAQRASGAAGTPANSLASRSTASSTANGRRSSGGSQSLPSRAPRSHTRSHASAALATISDARARVASVLGEDIVPESPPASPPALRPRFIEPPLKETMVVMPRWRKPVTEADIAQSIHFERTERDHVALQPSQFHWSGFLTFVIWLAAFGFYLYCRIRRTIDRHSNVFAYQIVVLGAEIIVGLVTARQGFTLLRRPSPKDPVRHDSLQGKGATAHKARKVHPPRKTVSGKRMLADAAAAMEQASSPVPDCPVQGRGSPARHPTTERVTEPSAAAEESADFTGGIPRDSVAEPRADTLGSQSFTASRSAISIVAMNEPSFSGAVQLPHQHRVSFMGADGALAASPILEVPPAEGTGSQGQLLEGEDAVTEVPPSVGEKAGPVRLKGIMKGNSDPAMEAVHVSAVALAVAAPAEPAAPALKRQYHVQVLLFGSTSNLVRTEKALRAAHTAEMPERCTRSVYLVDAQWDAPRSEFVAALGLDAIMYAPGIQAAKEAPSDWSRAATLNRVLRRLYPDENYGEGQTIANTELVVVLDADQVIDPRFFMATIPALELQGIRLVQTRPSYVDLTVGADILDLTLHNQFNSTVAGNECSGCVLAADSGFVVRADALRAVKWLPTYSHATGLALGKDLLLRDFRSLYIDEVLVSGHAPSTLHAAYALCKSRSRGMYQCLFHEHQNNGMAPIKASTRVLYNTLAMQQLVGSLALPLWVGIPVVQILFAVFPWDVNAWFGVGFLAYYVLATPLLFEVFGPSRAVGLWNSYTASYALSWSRVCAAVKSLSFGHDAPIPRSGDLHGKQGVPARERTPARVLPADATSSWWGKSKARKDFRDPGDSGWGDADAATPVAPTTPMVQVTAPAPTRERIDLEAASAVAKESMGAPPLDLPTGGCCAAIPWSALLIWTISGVAAGMGAWLLFGTGAPRSIDVRVLAANLPLVISILWALANHMTAGMAVCYALGIRRQALAVVSVLAQTVCCAAVTLMGVAAVGLGSGFGRAYRIGGPAARHGFIWHEGAHISGTPSQ